PAVWVTKRLLIYILYYSCRDSVNTFLPRGGCMDLPGFAHRLRCARLAAQLSQTQLAASTGLQQSHLSEWEAGTRPGNRITASTLLLLAGVLHTTPHYLLGWDDLVWIQDDQDEGHANAIKATC